MSPPLSPRALERIRTTPAPRYVPPPGPYYDPELFPEAHFSALLTTEHLRTQHLRYRFTLLKSGLPTVEDLLPEYINDHFSPRVRITRENCVAGPGIGACLAQLIWALVGQGEGVLMTAPFYDDYVRDIVHPAGAVPVLAHVPPTEDSLSPSVIPLLEKEIQLSQVPIRVLLVPNPHNPIPQVVPEETIKAYALLAEKHNLHLIVDEVFALSTFGDSSFPPAHNELFKSILSYDLDALAVDPSRVHVLAGPTKDFGASGFKLGLLISPSNPTLLTLLRPLFSATPISSASDALFTRVLQDKPFVASFLADNRAALRGAYELVARWCRAHDLTFTPANAGVYVLVDFAPFIDRLYPSDSALEERLEAVVKRLIAHRVFVKPTTSGADPIPTRFRVVYTQPRETMLLALRRIEETFGVDAVPM
uniref:Aminotransferase class I/classII large domain-containing protein n=1 Tax=Mycena chlorophos TaxID=658473 RepID=A0ABQ0LQK4_MYCCL|nr:predicted protein [Mycena chlorophos]